MPIEGRVGGRGRARFGGMLWGMPVFAYTAVTAEGRRVSGTLTGASPAAVLAELDARRLTALDVSEAERAGGVGGSIRAAAGKLGLGGGAGAAGGARRGGGRAGGGGIGARRLATAYGQLADLLRAGVPLMRGLRLLAGGRSNPRVAEAFGKLAEGVSQGTDLADAMAAQEGVFAPVHVAMVRAGERGGFLEPVLARLGQLLHKQADLRAKVIGSLIYPAILVGVGSVVLLAVFAVFVPRFGPLLRRPGAQLPIYTEVVLDVGMVVSRGWWALLLAGLVGAIVAAGVSRTPAVRAWWGRTVIRLPVVGPLVRTLAVARFARVLGTMLGNAVPLLAAMPVARDAAGNPVMAGAIDKAMEAVKQGGRLAPPLGESGLIEEDVVEMIAVAEAANNLPEVLVTTAETLESRVDRQMAVAVKLIEPVMLVLIAAVVGLVAFSLIVPMSNLSRGV